jgi:hypothetical protein
MMKVEMPVEEALQRTGVLDWPVWKKGALEFPWECSVGKCALFSRKNCNNIGE